MFCWVIVCLSNQSLTLPIVNLILYPLQWHCSQSIIISRYIRGASYSVAQPTPLQVLRRSMAYGVAFVRRSLAYGVALCYVKKKILRRVFYCILVVIV